MALLRGVTSWEQSLCCLHISVSLALLLAEKRFSVRNVLLIYFPTAHFIYFLEFIYNIQSSFSKTKRLPKHPVFYDLQISN